MIVRIDTIRGKVNIRLKDEFEKTKIINSVVRNLRESKRLQMFTPWKIESVNYEK